MNGGFIKTDFFKRYADLRGEDQIKRIRSKGRIAAQVKVERQKRRLSQQDLTNLADNPKSTIGRIEAGLTSPKEDTLLKLSKALNTTFIIDGTTETDQSNLHVQLYNN